MVSAAPTVTVSSGWSRGEFDDPIEVDAGRVDGGVVDALALEPGVERPLVFARGGTLDARTLGFERFEDRRDVFAFAAKCTSASGNAAASRA